MATYSIKDLEHLSGIKAHTLRTWEQRYGILKPCRTQTNIRTYSDGELRYLLNISLLNANGYKISKLASMCEAEIHQAVIALKEEGTDAPNQVSLLTLAMTELDEPRFEHILSAATLRHGLEHTMRHIIYPFFERIGVMWMTGSIHPCQEHFISNLVRQKVIAAIDAQPPVTNPDAPRFVLFLPEGEFHEISLLFCHFLLKVRNCRVIYLGANVPESDLSNIVSTYHPHFFLSLLTLSPGTESPAEFFSRLATLFPEQTFLASRAAFPTSPLTLPHNIKTLDSLQDLIQLADALGKP